MMPTYDYKCQKCGITVEVSHSVSEHGPRCDCGEVMQKVFTAVPAIFKGEGWGANK
jgi:putative FmdB family regulatory protein